MSSRKSSSAVEAVYVHDSDFFRYLDSLKWSRFQTASAIEAAALYALFLVDEISPYEKLALAVFVTVIVSLLAVLAVADENRSRPHLQRIEAFEHLVARHPYRRIGPRNMGKYLMRVAMGLLFLFNLGLVWKFADQIVPIGYPV